MKILEKSIGTTSGGSSQNIPAEIYGGMSGTIPRGILEGIYGGIHAGITEIGGICRCLLSDVSVKKSEGIKGRTPEAFLGTSPETITFGIPQDVHGEIHEGEISEEVL